MKTEQEIKELKVRYARAELIKRRGFEFMIIFVGSVFTMYAYAFYLGYDF